MNDFTGPVLRPGDDGYDAERAGFNHAVEHRPAIAVGATGAGDVQAAVALAASQGRPVAVLATGHQPALPSAGAVLINTRRMAGVLVDPVAATARVEAGARWQRVLEAATPYGLAPLNGSSPHVGAVGYTLGGGAGLLGRRYGFAADHVRGFEVVTADGRLRHVSADAEPDLFWALRGGKGNFGVVVAMEIGLFPVARLYGGGLYFPGEAASDVLHAYAGWTAAVPDEMASSVMLLHYPDDPAVPEPLRGRFVTHVRIAHSGPVEEGERLTRPLRDIGPRLLDTAGEMPYARVGSIHHEPTDPVAAYDRVTMLAGLDAAVVDTLLSLAGPQAGTALAVELRHFGGAYARPPAVPNAVGGRDAAFSLFSGSLLDPARLAEARQAHDTVHGKMRPWSTGGTFANFLGVDDTTPGHVRTAYPPAVFARLTDVKTRFDPANLFRINHNIPPR
ncbi:oxidoreductase [Microtetraspora sp. NBRC 13810]|uniref:FAD-binding oxidoreductase n=1 Tax=Microtetraspora sp. NBRC 13810 TaxID=3030990 RepID=UPI0024A34C27|nr:FAD-binding oxidoreductase [Microtetraspora sp. NBRC 13810]GLW05349.1 oxidoreductase [Microtetraspora sp. NBRC 13810]